jgi:hypothetical protein
MHGKTQSKAKRIHTSFSETKPHPLSSHTPTGLCVMYLKLALLGIVIRQPSSDGSTRLALLCVFVPLASIDLRRRDAKIPSVQIKTRWCAVAVLLVNFKPALMLISATCAALACTVL